MSQVFSRPVQINSTPICVGKMWIYCIGSIDGRLYYQWKVESLMMTSMNSSLGYIIVSMHFLESNRLVVSEKRIVDLHHALTNTRL